MTENRFNLWDIEGTAFIEDHKEGSYHIGKTEDVDINSLRDITKRLNIYAEENKQLKIDLGIAEDNHKLDKEIIDDIHNEFQKVKKENEQLKSDNFNLNKSVECLDETVKEQCNKIDWADECGVRWEEEYEKWKG